MKHIKQIVAAVGAAVLVVGGTIYALSERSKNWRVVVYYDENGPPPRLVDGDWVFPAGGKDWAVFPPSGREDALAWGHRMSNGPGAKITIERTTDPIGSTRTK